MNQSNIYSWVRKCGVLFMCALLSACASVELRPTPNSFLIPEVHIVVPPAVKTSFEQAPDCCDTLKALPLQELSSGGQQSVSIGIDSPAHVFESGKSFFAAYRIVDLPRPAYIEVNSYRSAEPGSIAQQLMPDIRQLVFRPTVLLLNDEFEPVRRLDAHDTSHSDCNNRFTAPAFSLPFLIYESPKEAAYLVLVSSAESLAPQDQIVCGIHHDSMSPVGDLDIEIAILPSDDQPVRMAIPVKWYPNTRKTSDFSIWQSITAGPRLLATGQTALHVLQQEGIRYRSIYSIPYAHLVRVSTDSERHEKRQSISVAFLRSGAEHGQQGDLRWDLFEIYPDAKTDGPTPAQIVDFISAQTALQSSEQTVFWRVLPGTPSMTVEDGSTSRIGQAAMKGGVATAFPCGICQTGTCPPEVLASCAALFSVGALLGGATRIIADIFTNSAASHDKKAAIAAIAAGEPILLPTRLEQCLSDEIKSSDNSLWKDGGLSAKSSPPQIGTASDGGRNLMETANYIAEVTVRQLIFENTFDKKNAVSSEKWLLKIRAQVDLVERTSGKRVSRPVEWLSEPYPTEEWTVENSSLPTTVVAKGCKALAHDLFSAAENAWKGK